MALYTRFILATVLLLISISLFQPTFAGGCGRSARKRSRLSMEYLKVEHHDGIDEAAVVNSTSEQTLSKVIHQQIQGKTASEENGQSGSLRQRKLKPKFHCKREIPGGPDPQHH